MRTLVSPGTVFGCATYCEQVVMLDTSARPVVVSCRAAAKLGALLRSPPQLEAQEVVDRVLCDRPHLPPMLSRSPSRHPPGFIEPCLPTLGRAVPSGPAMGA
jgi:hypothetical protein